VGEITQKKSSNENIVIAPSLRGRERAGKRNLARFKITWLSVRGREREVKKMSSYKHDHKP
jgi:hypothetical protein